MLNKKSRVIRTLALTILATALVGSSAWGQTFKVLHAFGNGDGTYPEAGQVFDAQGNLYGVTSLGPLGNGCGGDGCGTVYQLKPDSDGTWTETVLYAFNGSDGVEPASDLIFDPAGNLYGTAWVTGYGFHAGVVYQLTPNSNGTWTESTLHQFAGNFDGGDPDELALDAAGNVYGNTRFGGLNNTGIVYSLNRASGWRESLLQTFNGYSNLGGSSPYRAIDFDANGNLYGATLGGGTHSAGVVFELTKRGSLWQETVLYNFAGGTDGNTPVGVVFGPDGSLYGVTQTGGNLGNVSCLLGCGTVFKLTPNSDGTWTKTTLYAFRGIAGRDGAIPVNRITFDQAGNLYSTTAQGGVTSFGCYDGCGTVFKLTPSFGGHYTESVVHTFMNGSDGSNPYSPMVIDGAGNLYGTAANGGRYNYGVAYEITP